MSDEDVGLSDQLRVQRAVTDAEVVCGLAFTVVFCLGDRDDLANQAEEEFARLGLVERPHVTLLVEPIAGRFVLALAGQGRSRLSDGACDEVSKAMRDCYADTSNVAQCVEVGLSALCKAAGPPDAAARAPQLPSVVLVTAD